MNLLQNPPGEEQGRIKDPNLKYLLRELASHNPGLCIITTRIEVDDIKEWNGTFVQNIQLDSLSEEAGAELLKSLGVEGMPDEFRQAVNEFEGHALALRLLGSYLTVVYNGDIRQRDKIPRLTDEKKQGAQARRVMESYEEWFKDKPELNILRIMGLFDRPIEGRAIEVLKTKPTIKDLTSDLQGLSHADWQYALHNLRMAGLLAKEATFEPDTLDCHPLIREHFREKIKEKNPEAWKEANNRLYEHFKASSKQYPDTIEEMAPLYAAITHGCQAGRYEETHDVYRRRIQRGGEFYSLFKLGLFGACLAALSNFFELPWSRPVESLTESVKIHVLSDVSFCLEWLGRLTEAIQPYQAVLKLDIELEKWKDASTVALNLSHLNLNIGNLKNGLIYVEKGIELANRINDVDSHVEGRAALAIYSYYFNRISEAISIFNKIEIMKKRRNPKSPFLESVIGFEYCNLLLNQGKYRVVQTRATQTIKKSILKKNLLDIALDNLLLGRACILQEQEENRHDFTKAMTHLNQAIKFLRQAGTQEYIPRGLLAHAELCRLLGNLDLAKNDLYEAMSISVRCGMGLWQADCHLEYARLHLALGAKDKARESLDIAKGMIEKMGYHLRDKDVTEIEGLL